MSVKVKIYGMLRDALGGGELSMEFAGNTLGDLIGQLTTQYGERAREELLDEEGHLDSTYVIFLGGERMNSLSAKVKDGDEVVITSMIAGGALPRWLG